MSLKLEYLCAILPTSRCANPSSPTFTLPVQKLMPVAYNLLCFCTSSLNDDTLARLHQITSRCAFSLGTLRGKGEELTSLTVILGLKWGKRRLGPSPYQACVLSYGAQSSQQCWVGGIMTPISWMHRSGLQEVKKLMCWGHRVNEWRNAVPFQPSTQLPYQQIKKCMQWDAWTKCSREKLGCYNLGRQALWAVTNSFLKAVLLVGNL